MYYGTHHPKNTDSDLTLEWIVIELPALLAGWDSKKGGSERFKGQKLRMEEGGLGGESRFRSIRVRSDASNSNETYPFLVPFSLALEQESKQA